MDGGGAGRGRRPRARGPLGYTALDGTADHARPPRPHAARAQARVAQGPDAHGGRYEQVKQTLQELRLATVCEEASCPNVGECWGSGTATVMLMGEVCTRGCRFCDVSSGVPQPLDPLEPRHLAVAVGRLGLDYLVVTSGNRDELEGARWWRCSRPALRARGAPGDCVVPSCAGRSTACLLSRRAPGGGPREP